MARPTISQRIALEGGDQIKRALADLGKAGEDAFGKLQKAGEKVNLSGSVGALEASTKRAGATVDELRQRITGVGGAAALSGAGFAQFGGVVQTTEQRLAACWVSTPEQRCIGGPEQKYINGAGNKATELGALFLSGFYLACRGLIESAAEYLPDARWQRCMVNPASVKSFRGLS